MESEAPKPGRVSVVVFNLGGPDGPESVEPFLFNLFNDPAIIGLPGPLRWLVAKLISKRRAPVAREIYGEIGGRSPLVPLTEDQTAALAAALKAGVPDTDYDVVIAMRYWHPFADAAARRVAEFGPDAVVLLPLYPQFSTTTSGSSIRDFERALDRAGVTADRRTVCCYPTDPGLIEAHAGLIEEALTKVPKGARTRVLFSAHGLPKKVIDGGDPYQWQVEQTAARIVDALDDDGLDWGICYQSRVGPLEWIGPSTEDEIVRAGKDEAALVIVPVAFVSDHSETLVELDIEYADLARREGVPAYVRVPALATAQPFIDGLARIVGRTHGNGCVRSGDGPRLCPRAFVRCPHKDADAGTDEGER